MSNKGELPALRDGSVTVGGYQSIVEYLREKSDGKWDLDSTLDTQQKADSTA